MFFSRPYCYLAGVYRGLCASNCLGGRYKHLAAVLIILFAFGLRTYRLPSQSVWNDEFVCVAYLDAATWLDFKAGYKQHDPFMPPLYHVMLFCWSRIVGNDAVALRFLSMIISLASLCILYMFGLCLLGFRGALFALTLFAFSPQQIFHAQGIRCYSFVVFWALLSAYTFWNMTHEGKKIWWIANVLVNVMLVWTHLGGILLLVTWGVGTIIWLRRQWCRIVFWGMGHILFIIPLVMQMVIIAQDYTRIIENNKIFSKIVVVLLAFIMPFFKDSSCVLNALPTDCVLKTGLISVHQYRWGMCLIVVAIFLAILFMITVLNAVIRIIRDWMAGSGRSSEEFLIKYNRVEENVYKQGEAAPERFLLLWFLMPMFILFVPALFFTRFVLAPRYTIFASPSLYLLAAGSVGMMTKQKYRWMLGGGVVISMAILGISATLIPLRGNYLAVGRLLAEDGYNSPIAVLGDSPLLASQVAYNAPLPLENIIQVNSVDEIDSWLDERLKKNDDVWLVVEDTRALDNPEKMQSIERLLTTKKVVVERHLYCGPQMLIVYDIKRLLGIR